MYVENVAHIGYSNIALKTGVEHVSMKLAYLSRCQWTATWC